MEYLPFVIGIIIVAVRLYSNFQAEQEKSRRRNPAQPAPARQPEADQSGGRAQRLPAPESRQTPRSLPIPPERTRPEPRTSWDQAVPTVQSRPAPQPDLVKESYNPQHPYEPVYTREYKEPVYVKPEVSRNVNPAKRATPHRLEITPLEEISDETQKNRDIHKPHHHGFPALGKEEEHGYEIDIKEAVIMQAILNRPEH